MLIQIQENGPGEFGGFDINLIFDKETTFQINIDNPHTEEVEKGLEWYFEEYIAEPYTAEPKIIKNQQQIIDYGTQLFEQLFADEKAYQLLRNGIKAGLNKLAFEIISQAKSIEFQSILWETLRDPKEIEGPLVARGASFYRKSLKEATLSAQVNQYSKINLLIVTARPSEENDVDYRTVQRPLVEMIASNNLGVNPYILRPGTFQALKEHLIEVSPGFYHIIHFDLHGEVLEYEDLLEERKEGNITFSYNHSFGKSSQTFQVRYGRSDIKPFKGKKAFLFFETDKKGEAEPASAKEVATLIRDFQVPVVILNACQSAKQKGISSETSLAKFLQEHGVNLVLAMRYSVSVSAVTLIMKKLYEELFNDKHINEAISIGRRLLFDNKNRTAALGYNIELEDWLLPIIYQSQPVDFNLRAATIEEEVIEGAIKDKQKDFPQTPFGFYGRDLDILKIEKLLLQSNHLLLRGMVGVGKSELLKYLAAWWALTKFQNVNNVFYLDFKSPIAYKSFINKIAGYLFDQDYLLQFKQQDMAFRQRKVLEILNKKPHVLILDNIFQFSDKSIINFLSKLTGKSFVIYGSVNEENLLSAKTFRKNIYRLEGLDKDATYLLAKEIISKETEKDFQELIKENQEETEHLLQLLAGFPSAMTLVLPHLKNATVEEVLDKFRAGTLAINI